jgi:hypothetical protein
MAVSRARLGRNNNGRAGRPARRTDDARGSALVAVMAITTAVLLIGVSIFIMGHSEGDIVEYAVDDARAFYVAEGGLERARGWLGELTANDPSANPVGQRFQDQVLGGGSYTVTVTEDKSWMTGLPAYEVVSKAEHGGVVRGVRSVMVAETFARYQWFIESAGGAYSWFHSGERFEGPVHVNGDIRVDGDPWFGSIVRAGGVLDMKDGSNPTFTRGLEQNCDPVRLPDVATVENTIKVAAQNGGLYAPPLPAGSFYIVSLGWGGPGMITYAGCTGSYGAVSFVTAPKTRDISSLNGAAWFDDDIAIAGTIDGQLTVVANGDIEVWDDILYYDSTPYGGPNPDCDDVLGMIAAGHPKGDIIISYTPPNKSDCILHCVMMALQKNIEAQDYMHHPPRGDLIIYGGMMADYSIHLAQLDAYGGVLSGYRRDYRHDPRLFTMPPPFFPLTGRYAPIDWGEVRRSGA